MIYNFIRNRTFHTPFIFIAFWLIIFVISNLVHSKKNINDNYRLVKLHYENSLGEKGVTNLFYNQFGLMDRAKWQLVDDSRNSENYYTYDHQGNLIQKYREFSDGLISNIDFKYDDHNVLLSEHFERSDSVKGDVFYEYDENRKKLKNICKGLNGWFFGEIIYTYNENINPKEALIYQKGKETGKILYDYDSNNNLIKEVWDFSGTWSQTFVYKYENVNTPSRTFFTSSNVFISNISAYRVINENYDYSNQIGGPSLYTYDNNGKLIKKIFQRSDGFETVTTYNFDENGILNNSFRKYSNDLTAKFSYKYNGNRFLTKRNYERSDGIIGSEVYEYNGKWQLTKAIYENFDSWLTGTITFTYDLKGILKSGVFKGDKLDADISFSYDEFSNIVKVHWDFSNDKTQTYNYVFEKL